MNQIAPHTRLRRSPYYDATMAEGVIAFTPYNRMLSPLGYGDPDAEYDRLINGVSQWDVAVQRQIEIRGTDAAELTQILCTRDMSKCKIGQGKYVAMCNHLGVLINDPIVLKIAEDCFWFSIADGDVLMWARCIASERGLTADIRELDVAPMAIQGPMAEDVIASLFGDWVRQTKYFWFSDAEVNGISVKLARSGWSKQGGFEIYLLDPDRGTELWNIVREAGAPWNIGPGYPNPCERIESGLLSFGGDTDSRTNPFEVRLEKYVDLDLDDSIVGIRALKDIQARGVERHQLGVILDIDTPQSNHPAWYPILRDGTRVGDMTNGVWSRKLERMIGFALVNRKAVPGERVQVHAKETVVQGTLTELPFA
jgi:aminomethyltransferase